MVLFTAAITAVICAGAGYAAATEPDGRVEMVVLALFTGSVSLMMLLSLRGSRDPWSPDQVAGRPAWRLRLGGAGAAPGVTMVLTATALGLGFGAFSARETVGALVVLGVMALGVLVLAVQLGQVWLRAPSFSVSADRLVYDGAGIRVDLAWDDVGTVEFAHLGTRWSAVRISAVVGAPSYRHRSRPSLVPLDREPDPPGIELRNALLPDAPALLRLLRDLQVAGRPTRESMISRGLPDASGY